MNRHQRTVSRADEDAAARGYCGGCWTKTGPAWWWTMYHRPSLLSNTLMASSADGSPSGASLHVTQAAEPRRTTRCRCASSFGMPPALEKSARHEFRTRSAPEISGWPGCTRDVVAVAPHGLHLRDVARLEGVVERRVRAQH